MIRKRIPGQVTESKKNEMRQRKIYILIILTALMFAGGDAFAQQKTTKEMLRALEERHGVSFVYESGLDMKSLYKGPQPELQNIENDLDTIFMNSGVDWKLNGKYVILTPRKPITVRGHITDAQTGETLIAAGVLSDAGPGLGAVTNNFGYYTLTIPGKSIVKGRPIKFQYSYVGYESQIVTLRTSKDTVINIALKPSAEIKEAIVAARKDAGIKSTNMGAIEVPLKQIQNTPMILGEADVIKVIQMMPGVSGGVEGFAGMHVRGGGADENLVLLDGIPIYNMNHMLGLFSIFQPEAVKKVTLYKGIFPARFGGRVSSVLDIRTNDGNMKETRGMFSVGLLSDKFHIEGPIIKDKLSYSVSARGMHTVFFDPILRLALKDMYYNYFYYDLNGKVTWRINDKDRLYFGVYSGADRLNGESVDDGYANDTYWLNDIGMRWGNNVASVRWNHIFSKRLFANTTVAFNRYAMRTGSVTNEHTTLGKDYEISSRYDSEYSSGIRDYTAKIDFDYNPNPSHLVKFGAEYTFHNFFPESLTFAENEVHKGEQQIDTTYNIFDSKIYRGHELSVYAEDDIRIGEYLTVNPGLRVSWFNTERKNYFSAQPRVSAKLAFGNGLSFKAGYARMAQYVHQLSSGLLSMPTDLWVPITKDISPVLSDQYSVGAYYDGLKGWEFSLEGYWKNMQNVLEYEDGTVILGMSGGWEKKVAMGNGRAYGLEFYAEKTAGKVTGWLSYTLAKSDRHFPDGTINNGRVFPYKYDRRHNFNINATWEISRRIDLNASWSFLSGNMATVPERYTFVVEGNGWGETHFDAEYISSRNNYRLPPTHRLNLGVNLRKMTKGGNERIWNISLYNAYNSMNPNFVFMSKTYIDDMGEHRIQMEKITLLPILPSFSYTLKF